MLVEQRFRVAFECRDLRRFLELVFPPEWGGIAARILETGATMSDEPCSWAPRWSPISPTIRRGAGALTTYIKSCLFRAHDCLHQLWGLPIPSADFTEDDFYLFKRANMCGEVAVLTLTEFALARRLADLHQEIEPFLRTRHALPMLDGPLRGRSWTEIAARMDGILHKKIRPRWLREHEDATRFADDYVPMLEDDRALVDTRWALMTTQRWRPLGAPNSRYSPALDGLELTSWMIRDFFHLLDTDDEVDEDLATFNRRRRRAIVFPDGWR